MNIRSTLISVWKMIIDPIYFRFTRLTYIGQNNILRVRLTRYKGKPITLSDGTCIHRNDFLIKIHLHNIRLLMELKDIESDIKKAFYIYRWVEKSLPDLMEYKTNHTHNHKIKGIIGITMLNRGGNRLGFETVIIRNPWYKRFKCIVIIPIFWLFGSQQLSKSFKKQQLSYLFMSSDQLQRYTHKTRRENVRIRNDMIFSK